VILTGRLSSVVTDGPDATIVTVQISVAAESFPASHRIAAVTAPSDPAARWCGAS